MSAYVKSILPIFKKPASTPVPPLVVHLLRNKNVVHACSDIRPYLKQSFSKHRSVDPDLQEIEREV